LPAVGSQKQIDLQDRMFAVVLVFQDDTTGMAEHGLQFHAIRSPPPLAIVPGHFIDGDQQYGLPYKVFPVSAILRGLSVSPPLWPKPLFGMDSQTRNAQLNAAARCATGSVLVFWPPTRHTFIPQAVTTVPLHPDGANEWDPADEDDMEEADGAGVGSVD
jgi:hypothetical protein